jgi:transcriptional regulator with XRE-family HTH domain
VTPEQCRRARLLLGWSQQQLGQAVGVHHVLISRFEDSSGDDLPNLCEGLPGWCDELKAVLQEAGIEFTGNGEPAVRIRKQGP